MFGFRPAGLNVEVAVIETARQRVQSATGTIPVTPMKEAAVCFVAFVALLDSFQWKIRGSNA
jgi:hypothetical protein